MMTKRKIFVCIGLSTLFNVTQAITLHEISNFLLNPDLAQMNPQQLIDNNNFFGKLDTQLQSDDEIVLALKKKPNSLEATYMKLDGQWLLNDVSFSYYATKDENCTRQQAAYVKHLTKRLNNATFEEPGEGMFWQLPDRNWGIWLTVSQTINPFTEMGGCSSKIILVYSDLDAQNEDEDF